MGRRRLITAFGKTQSLTEWSRETGIDKTTIATRLDRHGWSPDDAVSKGNQNPLRVITAFGKTMTVPEWSRETGIKRETILSRIDRDGWTPERAMSIKNGHNADRMRRRKRVQRKTKKAVELLNAGMNTVEIAGEMNMSSSRIQQILREAGYGYQERFVAAVREVWRLRDIGTLYDIADQMNISQATVSRYMSIALRNPSIITPRPEPIGTCDCGDVALHEVDITVNTKTRGTLELCASCYELFLEIESADLTDIPTTKSKPRF